MIGIERVYASNRHAWDCNYGMLERSYALRARSEVREERIATGWKRIVNPPRIRATSLSGNPSRFMTCVM